MLYLFIRKIEWPHYYASLKAQMDSPCIKQTVCKVLKIFQHGKYLEAYVLNLGIKTALYLRFSRSVKRKSGRASVNTDN